MTPKILNELYDLSRQAVRTWRHTVMEAVKECDRELPIFYDDEEEEGLEMCWTKDNYVHKCEVTKIRYNKEDEDGYGRVEVFAAFEDGKRVNEWKPLYWFAPYECEYVLSEINWEK